MNSLSIAEINNLLAENARLKAACRKALDGFHFTHEYVGEQILPAIEGWSWYDAVLALKAALAEGGSDAQCGMCGSKKHGAAYCDVMG